MHIPPQKRLQQNEFHFAAASSLRELEKKIQICQIELKARFYFALSGSPMLYIGTARVRVGNSQKRYIKRKNIAKTMFFLHSV